MSASIERPWRNSKTSSAELGGRRIGAEPGAVGVQSRAHGAEPTRRMRDVVVVRCPDKHMVGANTEIRRVFRAGAGASDENDVVGLQPSGSLGSQADEQRTVAVALRRDMCGRALMGYTLSGEELVVGIRPCLGPVVGDDGGHR